MFTHEWEIAHANFNCLFKNEGFLEVTGSHVHRKCGNILEMIIIIRET